MEAKPDAVAHEAVGLCKTLNGAKHAQDRTTIASTLLGLDDDVDVRVDGVDRLGLEVRVRAEIIRHRRDVCSMAWYLIAFRTGAREDGRFY